MQAEASDVELISGPTQEDRPAESRAAPTRFYPRLVVFLITFVLACAIGLAYVYSRQPVYASTASLLVVPPESTGRGGSNSARINATGTLEIPAVPPGKLQHLGTEHQRLMSEPVMQAVADELGPRIPSSVPTDTPLAALQRLISADYTADTNIMELHAEGADKDVLAPILESWIKAYTASRTTNNATTRDTTQTELETQLKDMETLIENKRSEVDGFRRDHEILSSDRTENRNLAKLRGLNESINRAKEEEVKAQAHLNAVQAAIAAGQPVTQGKESTAIGRLEQRVMELREQVAGYDEKFTAKYIQIEPEIVSAKKNLAKMEQDLEQRKRDATAEVLATAQQELAGARESTASLENQQAALKAQIAEFSTRFQEVESMQRELDQLESEAGTVRDRLVRAQVAQADLFPTVTVLESPTTPTSPIRPDYQRDAGLAVAGSLALALITTLIFDFLTKPPVQALQPQVPVQADVVPNIYSYNTQVFPPHDGARPATDPAFPKGAPVPALQFHLPRELSPPEVHALFEAADAPGKVLIGLLLSGAGFSEAMSVEWPQLDADQRELRLSGTTPRTLRLPEAVQLPLVALAGKGSKGSVWRSLAGTPLGAEDLSALITYSANDAGIARPNEVTPDALRHTYLAFLVRQGLKLSEIRRVGGEVAPSVLAAYTSLSRPGPGRVLEEIDPIYPTFAPARLVSGSA